MQRWILAAALLHQKTLSKLPTSLGWLGWCSARSAGSCDSRSSCSGPGANCASSSAAASAAATKPLPASKAGTCNQRDLPPHACSTAMLQMFPRLQTYPPWMHQQCWTAVNTAATSPELLWAWWGKCRACPGAVYDHKMIDSQGNVITRFTTRPLPTCGGGGGADAGRGGARPHDHHAAAEAEGRQRARRPPMRAAQRLADRARRVRLAHRLRWAKSVVQADTFALDECLGIEPMPVLAHLEATSMHACFPWRRKLCSDD